MAGDFMRLAGLQWFKEVIFSKSFRAAAKDSTVPTSHYDIAGRDDADKWYLAEEEEVAQLIAMGTWELVPLPKDRKTIKSKWVYRIKTDADGRITRYKARLCACGYSQKAGIDYKDIYAPVFRMESSRLVLTIIASRKMKFHQMDVVGAFINGKLDHEIFMAQHSGFEDISRADYVLLLLRNLYGLKQAPRIWHQTIDPFLKKLGFTSLDADPCIYFQWDESRTNLQLICLYVDNLGIAADQQSDIDTIRAQLNQEYKMTDEPADQFLQMKLEYDHGVFYLSQIHKNDELLLATNMSTCFPASTPMDSLSISKMDCPVVGSEEKHNMHNMKDINIILT
jgi:hypothetical protein